eukprot:5355865-Amphidinium_carterae.2
MDELFKELAAYHCKLSAASRPSGRGFKPRRQQLVIRGTTACWATMSTCSIISHPRPRGHILVVLPLQIGPLASTLCSVTGDTSHGHATPPVSFPRPQQG